MFTLFKAHPKLPASFERWSEVDLMVASELLYKCPSVRELRSLDRWLDDYRRWRSCYDVFIKAADTLSARSFADDFDGRQYEHYVGLFLQSGQWRAILLMLLTDAPEVERSRHLMGLDGLLSELRDRIIKR